MRLVDEDVSVLAHIAIKKVVDLPGGFEVRLPDAEIAKYVRPGTGIVPVQKARWCNDEGATVKLARKKRGHVGLAEAHDIGQEHAAVLFDDTLCAQYGLLLVLQFLEASREVNILQLSRAVQFVFEILV
jgi:hypothetical protein